MHYKVIIFIICMSAFFSCKKENMADCFTSAGKTNVIYHDVKDFNCIELNDKMDLYLTQGSTFEVKVEAGANLQRLNKTELEGETLRVDNHNTCNFVRGYDHKISVYVTAPNFKHIKQFYLKNTTNNFCYFKLYALYLCENLKSKTYMTKPLTLKEARQRLDTIEKQLTLTVIYEKDFLEKLGYKGLEELRNKILDEWNWLNLNYKFK